MSGLSPGYELIDDQARIDPAAAHAFLTRSYWAKGIARETVARALRNSFCVAVIHEGQQVAMARVITDYASMAYLLDVYVLEAHRGQGLSKAMVAHLQDHPDLRAVRAWLLRTADAHGLYRKLGWAAVAEPGKIMERFSADISS
ncbi:GNAT family N-acetyltransferase [Caenibius sp. WL]|uniref:GNAT family N-acetyltransferase n=1 Tax=Caenibius sp. WL TaxID=2872646 RepID=UPI001C9A0B42|nr:GNAT family N-acetyltransferase [Caenibius sp. WL]QZP09112.1 GNAT family N-acetyltransferase [Caenibius sp. WL]